MRTSDAIILAGVAGLLAVLAVVLYSLVARQMYAKDKKVFEHHEKPETRRDTGQPR